MELTPAAADTLRHSLLQTLENEHMRSLDVIKACPEDMLGYRPHIKSMPFGKLAIHIYASGPWFLSLVGAGKSQEKEPAVPSKTDKLVKSCEGLHKTFVKALAKMTPEQLAAKHDFLGMGMFPAIVLLNFHMRHLIHHRGQMQMMLRMMGACCPAVYGPSGDVSFEELKGKAPKKK